MSRTRSAGMDLNPIEFSNIVAWLDLNGVTDTEDRRDIAEAVIALDRCLFELRKENGS